MFNLKNPLPQALRDGKDLQNLYKGLNLVPYAGSSTSSSHAFLKVLCSLYELSSSHATCINEISEWSFEGDIDITQKVRPGLKVNQDGKVEDSLKIEFYDMLNSLGVPLSSVGDLCHLLDRDYKTTGNAYLRLKAVRVGGVERVFLERIPPVNWMYIRTKKFQPRIGVVSTNFFDPTSWSKDEPTEEVLRVFPNVKKSENSVETVFHWKYVRDHSGWYGRPKSLHTLYDQFTEWRNSNHRAKVADTEFVSQFFLFLEKPDPNVTGIDGKPEDLKVSEIKASMKPLVDNSGRFDEVSGFNVMGYPNGAKEPKLEKLTVNRDHDWAEHSNSECSDNIYAAHGWSKIMTGKERAKTGVGGNVLIDEFIKINSAVVSPNQRKWEARMMEPLKLINEFSNSGKTEFSTLGIQFEDRLTEVVRTLSEIDNGVENEAANNIT